MLALRIVQQESAASMISGGGRGRNGAVVGALRVLGVAGCSLTYDDCRGDLSTNAGLDQSARMIAGRVARLARMLSPESERQSGS